MKAAMWINQTIYPDYRIGFLAALELQVGTTLRLSGGMESFAPYLRTTDAVSGRIIQLKNHFYLKRSLLWQQGLTGAKEYEGVFITEFNLRSISTLAIVTARYRRNLPTVFWGHIHGRSRGLVAQKVRAWLLRHCHGFICYTETQARQLRLELPSFKVWVAPNSICWEHECVSAVAPVDQIKDVLFVGRLTGDKKPELLLRAFILARDRGWMPRDSRCILIGPGAKEFAHNRYAKELESERALVLTGTVSRREALHNFYRTALCSVSPGYVGLSAIQSFSYGVPMLIAHDEQHSPEIEACMEGENCLYFQSNRVGALAEGLKRFHEDRNSWLLRRPGIAKRIQDTYTFEKMAGAFAAVEKTFETTRPCKLKQRPLRVAVYWKYYQAYHCARVRELLKREVEYGVHLMPIALTSAGGEHHRGLIEEDIAGRVRVLSRRLKPLGTEKIFEWRRMLRTMSELQPDVLFTPGYTGLVTLSAMRWMRWQGRAAVLMFETLEHDRMRWRWKEYLKRRVVSWYDASFTGGRLGRAYLNKLGVPDSAIFTGYDAVDNDGISALAVNVRASSEIWEKQLGLRRPFFLAVGRMIAKKNFASLVQAYTEYRQILKDTAWDLVIVGDGPEMPNVTALVQAAGLEAVIHRPGYRSATEIVRYMALARAFVMPSSQEEQWGLVINEAMACGLPVIASDICGATPELIVEGHTGFSFAPEDRAKLIEHLLWCTNNRERLRPMGLAAQRQVNKCSLEAFARSFYAAAKRGVERASWRNVR
jgi:1,2-diacylglycerol 3-alpha-glucosyltransferase